MRRNPDVFEHLERRRRREEKRQDKRAKRAARRKKGRQHERFTAAAGKARFGAAAVSARSSNGRFDELEAQGHLDPGASGKASAFEAYGRLSADGRLYLRSESESP
jgi:hypothetical protein